MGRWFKRKGRDAEGIGGMRIVTQGLERSLPRHPTHERACACHWHGPVCGVLANQRPSPRSETPQAETGRGRDDGRVSPPHLGSDPSGLAASG